MKILVEIFFRLPPARGVVRYGRETSEALPDYRATTSLASAVFHKDCELFELFFCQVLKCHPDHVAFFFTVWCNFMMRGAPPDFTRQPGYKPARRFIEEVHLKICKQQLIPAGSTGAQESAGTDIQNFSVQVLVVKKQATVNLETFVLPAIFCYPFHYRFFSYCS